MDGALPPVHATHGKGPTVTSDDIDAAFAQLVADIDLTPGCGIATCDTVTAWGVDLRCDTGHRRDAFLCLRHVGVFLSGRLRCVCGAQVTLLAARSHP